MARWRPPSHRPTCDLFVQGHSPLLHLTIMPLCSSRSITSLTSGPVLPALCILLPPHNTTPPPHHRTTGPARRSGRRLVGRGRQRRLHAAATSLRAATGGAPPRPPPRLLRRRPRRRWRRSSSSPLAAAAWMSSRCAARWVLWQCWDGSSMAAACQVAAACDRASLSRPEVHHSACLAPTCIQTMTNPAPATLPPLAGQRACWLSCT